MTLSRFTIRVAMMALIASYPTLAKADIYFADEGTHSIREANLDGSNVTTIVSGLSAPRGVAIDYATQQLYWTDAFAHVIQCSNLDGSNVQTLLTLPNATLNTIALDIPDGKMFFSSSVQGLIMEANLNGTGLQTIVSGLNDPVGIAVDPVTGKVYWTGGGVTQSANLDGSDVQTLLNVGGRDISINTATGTMYFGGNSGIYSASLNGSNLQLLATTDLQFSQMGVDFTAGKIYWDDIEPRPCTR
jgi:DNA-binding beta-propeller fold protein YncE